MGIREKRRFYRNRKANNNRNVVGTGLYTMTDACVVQTTNPWIINLTFSGPIEAVIAEEVQVVDDDAAGLNGVSATINGNVVQVTGGAAIADPPIVEVSWFGTTFEDVHGRFVAPGGFDDPGMCS